MGVKIIFSNNGQLFITLAWVFKIKEMQIFARTIEIYKENWAFSDLLGRDYFKRALTYMNNTGQFYFAQN